jgi:nucleoside-diphosphate-sugar epimerase
MSNFLKARTASCDDQISVYRLTFSKRTAESMSDQHTILVTAGAGNIGTRLVPRLLESGHKVVLPTSNAERLHSKLSSQGVVDNLAVEQGSIRDPQWIQSLLTTHKVDVVFLCLTGTDELLTSLNFLDAMVRAGTVKHLVYLSLCGDVVSSKGIANVMRTSSAAHVVVSQGLA